MMTTGLLLVVGMWLTSCARLGLWMACLSRLGAGQVSMTGADGLLPALVKEALERGLAAELTEHLGYDKGEPTSQARGNARNGTTSKMVDSEVGPFEIEVPRDRAGTFTPRPGSAMGQRRWTAWMRVNHQA